MHTHTECVFPIAVLDRGGRLRSSLKVCDHIIDEGVRGHIQQLWHPLHLWTRIQTPSGARIHCLLHNADVMSSQARNQLVCQTTSQIGDLITGKKDGGAHL